MAELSGENVVVPGNTGFLVTATLAHVLAEKTRAWPLTDQRELANAYLGVARRQGASRGAVAVVEADLQVVIPNLESIELLDWLRFRDDHRPELEAYRKSVRQLARDASHASDGDEAQEILTERRDQVEEELEAKRSIFRKLTSDSAPATLTFIAEVGALVANPAVAGAVAAAAAARLSRGASDTGKSTTCHS